MKIQITPGPWIAQPFDMNQCRVIPEGNHFFSVAAVSGFNAPEATANAALIAAAPEMLSALTQLANYFEVHTADSGRTSRGEEVWQLAKAAIRKAGGL